jgi:hypothetical protein
VSLAQCMSAAWHSRVSTAAQAAVLTLDFSSFERAGESG